MGEKVMEIVKKDLPQPGTDDRSDEDILDQQYQMLLAEVLLLQYPSAQKEATEYGQGPHQPIPLHCEKMNRQRYIGVDIPVNEQKHGFKNNDFFVG